MKNNEDFQVHSASFRDPSGFIFYYNGNILRQINLTYKNSYEDLMNSGLYDSLSQKSYIVKHVEVDNIKNSSQDTFKTIQPEKIPFISYPYEWCFSQLKDAALLTLKIYKESLSFNLSLKDASIYNIQFINNSPIFIDTLSFEKYEEGTPWVAYAQFCRHFLAPLVLMKYTDIRLNQLLKNYIDGIPLDLASKLLPAKTYANFSIFSHIHFHSRLQDSYSDKNLDIKNKFISKFQLLSIIDNLENLISKMNISLPKTEWGDYYNNTNYSEDSFRVKKQTVEDFLNKINIKSLWDIGANDGSFSRIASNKGIYTISMDIDPAAVEKNYLKSKKNKETNLLPLLIDLTNPSPAIGWENNERYSIQERENPECIMALALIHHIAISNNVPFEKFASFLSNKCSYLILEFVQKDDSQVQKLLQTRKDIFNNYSEENFKDTFSQYFDILQEVKISGSFRTLYLMKKK